MVTLPPAEDLAEHLMDRRVVRFSVDLTPADYARLVGEQHRRRLAGDRVTLRELVIDAIRLHLPEPS